MKWYAGSDHAGRNLKQFLVKMLLVLGDDVEDIGTHTAEAVDYPDYARAVAHKVLCESGARGLLVCGTGIGISMAANKVSGIRAAVVTDAFTAVAARAHNDANVISFGERVIGSGVAQHALQAFRDTAFEGGRHQRRVGKLEPKHR